MLPQAVYDLAKGYALGGGSLDKISLHIGFEIDWETNLRALTEEFSSSAFQKIKLSFGCSSS